MVIQNSVIACMALLDLVAKIIVEVWVCDLSR